MKRIVKVLKHSDIANIVINEKGDCYDLIAEFTVSARVSRPLI